MGSATVWSTANFGQCLPNHRAVYAWRSAGLVEAVRTHLSFFQFSGWMSVRWASNCGCRCGAHVEAAV